MHYWFQSIDPKQLLETVGVDKVLLEKDFPYQASFYPGVQQHLLDTLGGYDYAVREKVLQDNAATLCNLVLIWGNKSGKGGGLRQAMTYRTHPGDLKAWA